VADDVWAVTAPGGRPAELGRLSSPVALETHGVPDEVTGLAGGLPASELEFALALHCQAGCA
jgi:hypothetical protein